MQNDEYLLLANRSSSPLKRSIILPNGAGIIDADYYNNEGNEGEIYFQLINMGLRDVTIKGERIGQGFLCPIFRLMAKTNELKSVKAVWFIWQVKAKD